MSQAASAAAEDERWQQAEETFPTLMGGPQLLASITGIQAQGCYQALDQVGSTFTCYCYLVEAQRGEQRWHIFRRYREFEALASAVPKGVQLPSLPKKRGGLLHINGSATPARYHGLLSWLQALQRTMQTTPPSSRRMPSEVWDIFVKAVVAFLSESRDSPPKAASQDLTSQFAHGDERLPPPEVQQLITARGALLRQNVASFMRNIGTSDTDATDTQSLATTEYLEDFLGSHHRNRFSTVSTIVERPEAEDGNDGASVGWAASGQLGLGSVISITEAAAPRRVLTLQPAGEHGFGLGKVDFAEDAPGSIGSSWRIRCVQAVTPSASSSSGSTAGTEEKEKAMSVAGVQLSSHAWATKARRVAMQIEQLWLDGQALSDEILDGLIEGSFGQPPTDPGVQSMTIAFEAGVPYRAPRTKWGRRRQLPTDEHGAPLGCCRMGYNHPSGGVECMALCPPEYPPHTVAPWYIKARRSVTPVWVHYVDEVLCLSYVVPLRWHHAFAGTVSLDFGVSATTATMGVSEGSQTVAADTHDTFEEVLQAPLQQAVRRLEMEFQLPSEDKLRKILSQVVLSNPRIFGACIAFEPNVWMDGREKFSIYACHRPGRRWRSLDFAELPYAYHEEEWYRKAITEDGFKWSAPYYDDGGGNVWMRTLSSPFLIGGSKFAGVATLDVSYEASLQAFFHPPDIAAPHGRCTSCKEPVGEMHWVHHVEQHLLCRRCMQRGLQPMPGGYEASKRAEDADSAAAAGCISEPGQVKRGSHNSFAVLPEDCDVTAYVQLEHAVCGRLLSMALLERGSSASSAAKKPRACAGGSLHELRLQPEEDEDANLQGSPETWFSMQRCEDGTWLIESVAWQVRLSAAVVRAVSAAPAEISYADGVVQLCGSKLAGMSETEQQTQAPRMLERTLAPLGSPSPERLRAAAKANLLACVLAWQDSASKWKVVEQFLEMGVAAPNSLAESVSEVMPLPIVTMLAASMPLPPAPSLILAAFQRSRAAEDLGRLATLCSSKASHEAFPWADRAALTDHLSMDLAAGFCRQASSQQRLVSLFSKCLAKGPLAPEGRHAWTLASRLSALPAVLAEVPNLVSMLRGECGSTLGAPEGIACIISVLNALAFPREGPLLREVVFHLPHAQDQKANACFSVQTDSLITKEVAAAAPAVWKDCMSLISRVFRRVNYNCATLEALRLLRRYALRGALPLDGCAEIATLALQLVSFEHSDGTDATTDVDTGAVKAEACFLIHDIANQLIHASCLSALRGDAEKDQPPSLTQAIDITEVIHALKANNLPPAAVESLSAISIRLVLDATSRMEVRRFLARTLVLTSEAMLMVLRETEADVASLRSVLGEQDLMLDKASGAMNILGSIRGRLVSDEDDGVPINVVCDIAAAVGIDQAMLDTLVRLRTYDSPLTSAAAEHCYAVLVTLTHSCSQQARRRLQRRLVKTFGSFIDDLSHWTSGGASRLCVELLVDCEGIQTEALDGFVAACLKLLRQRPQALLLRSLSTLLEKRRAELRNKRLEVCTALCSDPKTLGILGEPSETLVAALQKGPVRYEMALLETLAACVTDEVEVLASGAAVAHDLRCMQMLAGLFPVALLADMVCAAHDCRMKSILMGLLSKLHGPGVATPNLLADFTESLEQLTNQPTRSQSPAGSSAVSSVREWVGGSHQPVESNTYVADYIVPHYFAWLEREDILLRSAMTVAPPQSELEVALVTNAKMVAEALRSLAKDPDARAALGAEGIVTPSLVADILQRCESIRLLPEGRTVDREVEALHRMLENKANAANGAAPEPKVDEAARCLSDAMLKVKAPPALGEKTVRVLQRDPDAVRQLCWALLRLHSERHSSCRWTAMNTTKLTVQGLRTLCNAMVNDIHSLTRLLFNVLTTTRSKAVLHAALRLGNALLVSHTEAVQQALLTRAELAGSTDKAMNTIASALPDAKLTLEEEDLDATLMQWYPRRDAWRLSLEALLFMQRLCEGHNQAWQTRLAATPTEAPVGGGPPISPLQACAFFLRAQLQPGSSSLMGLLYWDCYFELGSLKRSLGALIQGMRCLTELCQGPHVANQAALLSNRSSIADVATCTWYALLNADRKRGFSSYGAWDADRYDLTSKLQLSLIELFLALVEGGTFSSHTRSMGNRLAVGVDWKVLQDLLQHYLTLRGRKERQYVSKLLPRYVVMISSLRYIIDDNQSASFASLCASDAFKQILASDAGTVGCCEVRNSSGDLELLHFKIPSLVRAYDHNVGFQECLRKLFWEVPRENPMQRVHFFIERAAGEAVWELTHSSKNPLLVWQSEVFAASFWLAIALNISYIILETPSVISTMPRLVLHLFEDAMRGLGLVQLCLSVIRLMSIFASSVQHRLGSQARGSLTQALVASCSSLHFAYQLAHCFASLQGLSDPHFYFLHLFDICERQALLAGTLRSLRSYIPSLASAAALWLIIMYTYAILGHLYFPEEFPEKECQSVFGCLVFVLNFGLRAGGGIGDILQGASGEHRGVGRFSFDVSFFVVSTVVMSNIVSGIIIDAFSESRERRKEILEDERSKCFVCCISAARFDRLDRSGGGFAAHCQGRHNVIQYCLLLAYLSLKDPNERTGTEDYVKRCIDDNRCDFMPIHIASLPSGDIIEEEDTDAE